MYILIFPGNKLVHIYVDVSPVSSYQHASVCIVIVKYNA